MILKKHNLKNLDLRNLKTILNVTFQILNGEAINSNLIEVWTAIARHIATVILSILKQKTSTMKKGLAKSHIRMLKKIFRDKQLKKLLDILILEIIR